jgi:hypothetical protein
MRKKTTILATACVIIVVVVFFEFYVFKTPTQQATTVNIIMNDPSAWVSKTVVVEGNISYYINLLEGMPWNYQLSSNGATIGVSWQGNSDFLNGANWTQLAPPNAGVNVRVLGVVTEGQVTPPISGTPTLNVYFIEAETIEPL